MEDLRRLTTRHKNRGGEEEEEDRISQLPDELIHHILSFTGIVFAIQTCVLSKRWVNLWSTFPHLNFQSLARDADEEHYSKFVTNLLSKRNQLCDTCTIRIDCRPNQLITRMIVEYAVCHNVKHFYVDCVHIDSKLSFPVLETLHLTSCRLPLMDWSLPCLKSLHLDYVNVDGKPLSFEGFSNLEDLSLSRCVEFGLMDVFVINAPNVTRLSIMQNPSRRPTCKFVINAPNLSCFRLYTWGVPALSSKDDFPCLEEVDFDIIDISRWKRYSLEDSKEVVLKLVSLFREFSGTKFLTLTFETIQLLSEILDHIRCQPSPFIKLKSLNLRGCVPGATNATKFTNNVIDYLLNGSPGAKIFVEEFKESQRRYRSYNPRDDILFREDWVSCGVKSRENMALKQPATSNFQENGNVMYQVLGVIPPATVYSEINSQTCSYSKHDSFSLWEGHLVYHEYVDLLTYIKKKHPETFDNFAPKTDIINTLGLNTLCSLVRALSGVSGASFTTSAITRYRELFTDLEKWGFNTTWLVNLLNNADEFAHVDPH